MLKKKNTLKLAALGAVFMLAVTSCGGPSDSGTGGSTGQPSGASTSAQETAIPSETPLAGLTEKMVLNAPIPSMCGFPAGTLKDGKLPKEHPEYSMATAPVIVENQVIVGDLTGDGIDDLAAVFYCDNGGVSWPSQIQIFENTKNGIAALGKPFQISELTAGARGYPDSFEYYKGEIALVNIAMGPSDASATPSRKIKAKLKWDGKQLTTTAFADISQNDTQFIETSLVNGDWCVVAVEEGTDGNCVTIAFPNLTFGEFEPESLSLGIYNGATYINMMDASLGILYPAGEPLMSAHDPKIEKLHLDQDRIYNASTGEFYVRLDT